DEVPAPRRVSQPVRDLGKGARRPGRRDEKSGRDEADRDDRGDGAPRPERVFPGAGGEPHPDRKDRELAASGHGNGAPEGQEEQPSESQKHRENADPRFGISGAKEEKREEAGPGRAGQPEGGPGERPAERRQDSGAASERREQTGGRLPDVIPDPA